MLHRNSKTIAKQFLTKEMSELRIDDHFGVPKQEVSKIVGVKKLYELLLEVLG
jgi:hypothetical protein